MMHEATAPPGRFQGDLVVNPTLWIAAARMPGDGKGLRIRGFLGNQRSLDFRVPSALRDLAASARKILEAGPGARADSLGLGSGLVQLLGRSGLLVSPADVSTFRPFCAPLVEEGDSARGDAPELALRGRLWTVETRELPGVLASCRPDLMACERPLFCHQPDPRAPFAFWWPDPACAKALEAVAHGRQPANRRAVAALLKAGVLMSCEAASTRSCFMTARAQQASSLAELGFARLEQVMQAGQVTALAAFYRRLVEGMMLPPSDGRLNRFRVYDEPIGRLIQHALLPLVRDVARVELVPSYTYAVIYHDGAELPMHKDREQCEYTLSLQVFADSTGGPPAPWPLLIEHPSFDSPIAMPLENGDAVLFRGRRLRHGRAPLPQGVRSCSLLLHYVHPDFQGSLG